MFAVLTILLAIAIPKDISPYLGIYRGSIRNTAGTAQLGLSEAVLTTVMVESTTDSLFLRAISRSAQVVTLGAWHRKQITVNDGHLTARGKDKGALEAMRSMNMQLKHNVQMMADLTLRQPRGRETYFESGAISIIALKIR
jgi:hypothetical protein